MAVVYPMMHVQQAPDALPLRRMTFEEWADMDEDEPGELVDGQLIEEEMPNFAHESTVGWFIQHLRGWVVPQGGAVGGSEGKLKVTDKRGRKADVFVYLPGARRPRARDSLLTFPPDILIEVVSPRPRDVRRDRVEKTSEYAAFGVRYYWIVDPWARSLEIMELGADGRYVRALDAAEGTITAVPGCAGLTLDLDALWAELDRLDADDPAER